MKLVYSTRPGDEWWQVVRMIGIKTRNNHGFYIKIESGKFPVLKFL
jgi:hypothetical protein